MAHARLHLICGNCGCNDMWKFRTNEDGQDFGDYYLPEVYLICGNCATLHSLSDNAEVEVDK